MLNSEENILDLFDVDKIALSPSPQLKNQGGLLTYDKPKGEITVLQIEAQFWNVLFWVKKIFTY